jgi:hypothetical protein
LPSGATPEKSLNRVADDTANLPYSTAYLSRALEDIHDMRTFVAFLLGIAVTVGAAYYHDTVVTGADAAATKRVVNWEVVREVTGTAVDYAQAQWNRVTK